MAPVITAIKPQRLKGLLVDNPDLCTVEATVATGLEDVAAAECVEKLGVSNCVEARGRVFMDLSVADVPKVLELRSIDNVNVVLAMTDNFAFAGQREQCFEQLYKFVEKPDWKKGMKVWKEIFSYPDEPIKKMNPLKNEYCQPRPEVDLKKMKFSSKILDNLPEGVVPEHLKGGREAPPPDTSADVKRETTEEPTTSSDLKAQGPKFRISCSRTGSTHNFGSPEAARQFGAGVNDMFGWPVDLTNFDLEVLLCIDTEFVYVALCLTKEPLFKRNITNFGRTNLRATLCYNMMRLAMPQPGEVVVDPMCGGATIPMEGSLTHRQVVHLCGDNQGQAVKRSRDNINYLVKKGESMVVDVAQWDATRLPLRNQSVDVVVSDLPFGKRVGKKADNRVLYYHSLVELARVTKINTGRAVLLTCDAGSMLKNIKRVSDLWKTGASRTINIGGLSAIIYTLYRTSQVDLNALDKTHGSKDLQGS